MKRLHSLTAIALTGIVGFSAACAPIAAQASEEGKRNTAIGLGVAAAALLLTQKNKVPGLIVAGGAAIALSQTGHDRDCNDNRYNNDHRFNRDDRNRDRGNNDRFGRDNDSHYRVNDRNGNQDFRNRGGNDDHGSRHTAFGR